MLARSKFFLNKTTIRNFCQTNVLATNVPVENGEEVDEFAQFESLVMDVIAESKDQQPEQTFAKMLRNSHFVKLGDFNGRTVAGTIEHRIQDDLYVDFGLKFPAVVKAPFRDNEKFLVGEKVLLRLFDPELSERFLGSKKDLTLLEADAQLIRLQSNVTQSLKKQPETKAQE
uniref:S1 motif domain-containing protein n=1 Tax=Rhabditophanes sp. KR3021 TaxID=114890 RepID=A0AC35UFH2_9BILA